MRKEMNAFCRKKGRKTKFSLFRRFLSPLSILHCAFEREREGRKGVTLGSGAFKKVTEDLTTIVKM